MRRLIWFLLIVSSAVGLALLMNFNDGNVALLWPPYRVDVSINVVVLLLAGGFVLLHLLLIALSNAIDLPQRVRAYRERRAREAAVGSLRDGLLAFFEGRYGRAERLSQGALDDPSLATPAALLAARAAHRLRDPARRERWLESAALEKSSANAVLMSRAEMAVEDRRPSEALDAVGRLHARGARHLQALRMALRAHEQAGHWLELVQVLRQLEKRDAVHPSVARGLRIRAYRELFGARADDAHAAQALLASMKSEERDIDEVVEVAARSLATAGAVDQALVLLVNVLDRRFAERLVPVFAGLSAISVRERLRRVEMWRGRHGEHPALLIAAGRLCAAEGLWGKAEEFLIRAEALSAQRESRVLLASLYERIGRQDDARRYWRLAALDGEAEPLGEWPSRPIAASGPTELPAPPDGV